MTEANRLVILGKIIGVFGVRGWLKLRSYTQPQANLLNYRPWIFINANGEINERAVQAAHEHGKGLVALLEGCTTPESALPWVGYEIGVRRALLPPTDDGEYYWSDLIGLAVVTVSGVELGRVDYLLETGANDVLVVAGERERLIPYLAGRVVQSVDLATRRLIVDWDPEF